MHVKLSHFIVFHQLSLLDANATQSVEVSLINIHVVESLLQLLILIVLCYQLKCGCVIG